MPKNLEEASRGISPAHERNAPEYSLASHLIFFSLAFGISGLGAFFFLFYVYVSGSSVILSSFVQIMAITLFVVGVFIGFVLWYRQEAEKCRGESDVVKGAIEPQSYWYKLIIGGDAPKHKQGLLYWVIVGVFGIGFGATGLYVLFSSFTKPEIVGINIQEFTSISITFGLLIALPLRVLVLKKR